MPDDYVQATVVVSQAPGILTSSKLDQQFAELEEYKYIVALKEQEEELEAQEYASEKSFNPTRSEADMLKLSKKLVSRLRQSMDESHVELDSCVKCVEKDFAALIAGGGDEAEPWKAAVASAKDLLSNSEAVAKEMEVVAHGLLALFCGFMCRRASLRRLGCIGVCWSPLSPACTGLTDGPLVQLLYALARGLCCL